MNTPDDYFIACARIEDNARLKTKFLDLGDLELAQVPASIKTLSHLKKLAIRGITDLKPLEELTNLTSLNLSRCDAIADLRPLEKLTKLTSLNLRRCKGITDLKPLERLTELASLSLRACNGITNLEPLEKLRKLASLDLAGGAGLRYFRPIRDLSRHLNRLFLFGCRFLDLDRSLCGSSWDENVADQVRNHFENIKHQGRVENRDCKLLVVGNGAAGKSSLIRLLRGLPHRENQFPTHAIRVDPWETYCPSVGKARIDIWDFGGQNLYHQTHRLFFQGAMLFVVVWDPWEDRRGEREAREFPVPDENPARPLQYWVDQIIDQNADARIMIVRNKADYDDPTDPDWETQLPRYKENIKRGQIQYAKLSCVARSQWDKAVQEFLVWVHTSVSLLLAEPDRREIGAGRFRVKEVIRAWQKENDDIVRANETSEIKKPIRHPYVERRVLDKIVNKHCKRSPDAEDSSSLLTWLHRSGVIFFDPELFGEKIIIDQRWAINGIYTVLDRECVSRHLAPNLGQFTLKNLGEWSWNALGYSPQEQWLFLAFMKSCGICFLLLGRTEAPDGEALYVAPAFLSEEDNQFIQQRREIARHGLGEPSIDRSVSHSFLSETVAIEIVNFFGKNWGRQATLWKWGVSLEAMTEVGRVAVEITWTRTPGPATEYGGTLRILVWGHRDDVFLAKEVLQPISLLRSFAGDIRFDLMSEEDSRISDLSVRQRARETAAEDPLPTPEPTPPVAQKAISQVWFCYMQQSRDDPREIQFQEALRTALGECRSQFQLRPRMHGYPPPPMNASASLQAVAKQDVILVMLTASFLQNEDCLSDLVAAYHHLGGNESAWHSFNVVQMPSAGDYVNKPAKKKDPRRFSAKFLRFWKLKLMLEQQQKSNLELFDLIAKEAEWSKFQSSLAECIEIVVNPMSLENASEFRGPIDRILEKTAIFSRERMPAHQVPGLDDLPELNASGELIDNELLDALETFVYVGMIFSANGAMDATKLRSRLRSKYKPMNDPKLRMHTRLVAGFFERYFEKFGLGQSVQIFEEGPNRIKELTEYAGPALELTQRFLEERLNRRFSSWETL